MSGFRVATEGDQEALVALINDAYHHGEFFLAGERIDITEVREMWSRGRFWVHDGDLGLDGAIYVRIDGDAGYFGTLAVRPSVRGAGLGHRLIEHAERLAREAGCRAMALKVAHLRTDLIPWYERLGYRSTSEEPFPASIPVTEPVHFVLMSKPLAAVEQKELAR